MTSIETARIPNHPIDALFWRRWSPRALTGERLQEGVLEQLFEAVRWAPSSNNSQPWRLIYAHKGEAGFENILGVINERNQRWARNASVLLLLLSKATTQAAGQPAPQAARNHSFDAGAAWAHFALQAYSLGLTAHAIGGFDPDKARSEFNIGEHYYTNIAIALGRQALPDSLPEELKARETPSNRLKIEAFVRAATYDPSW